MKIAKIFLVIQSTDEACSLHKALQLIISNFFASLQELRSIAAENRNVHVLQIDLKDFDKYPEIVDQVENVVKDAGLNVLFNSAGIR